jgi:4-alpha-glucanotransferase
MGLGAGGLGKEKETAQGQGSGAALGEAFTPAVHRALLDLIHGSRSELTLLLIQDVLGSRDRINTPSTVGEHNWTYRLPGTVEDLRADREVQGILAMVRESILKGGRAP